PARGGGARRVLLPDQSGVDPRGGVDRRRSPPLGRSAHVDRPGHAPLRLFHGLLARRVQMLLNGVNHVAILTNDTDRLVAFYRDVFDAAVDGQVTEGEGTRLTFIRIGEFAELNVFQVDGNAEADRQTPMFGRGRIDHLGLQAA